MTTARTTVQITAEDKTAAAFASVKEKLTGLQTAVAGFKKSITGGIISAAVIMEGARALEGLGRAVYDNTVVWQGMEYTLQAAGLSSAETTQQLHFLEATSLQLGLNIKDVSSAFSRFILTGRAAGVPLADLDSQFKAVSEAMRIFHLSNNQTTRSWLALSEVMAMGTLHSRQFTQQLGRDWPGIGALIAGALYPGQDSLARFQTAMEHGKISSEDFMKGFQKVMAEPAMQGALNNAIDSIQAAMGRFQTTLFNFFNEADNPDALNALKDGLNSLSATLNDPNVKKGFDSVIGGLMTLVSWAAKAVGALGTLGDAIGEGLGRLATGVDLSGDKISILNDNIKNVKQSIGELQMEMNRPANQTGAMQNILQNQIDQKQQELKNLQASLKAMQEHPALDGMRSTVSTSAPAAAAIPALDTSALGDTKKQTAAQKYAEAVRGLDESMKKLAADAASVKPIKLIDKGELPMMREAIDALKQTKAISEHDTQQTMTDIQMMVGQEVDGVVVTADMAQEAIAAMTDKAKDANKQMSEFAVKAAHNIQDSTAKLFDSIGQKGTNLKSIMHDLFASIAKDAANMLSAQLWSGVSGGGSSGGLINMISSFFSRGAAGSSGAAGDGEMMGGAFAAGGTAPAGKISLVGEAGPELFMPHTSGDIIPNSQLRGLGGTSHTVNIDARGAGPDETAKLLAMRQQILAEMRGQTEYRLNRNAWMTT
ncbi:MAG: tape measure protein [Gammaproteobacteria bacterium]